MNRCAAAVAGLVLSAQAFAQSLAPNPTPQVLAELARQHGVCAVAVASVRAGQLQPTVSASGCAAVPVPAQDAVFQGASLSKPMFAQLVLQLVAQGRLSLDTPLWGLLPPGVPPDATPPAELEAVRVRHVLNHSTGLPNWPGGAPMRFDFAPGQGWQYSGQAYVMLQRAVEQLTGEPLQALMQREVLTPAGLRDSSFVWREDFAPRIVVGQVAAGPLPERRPQRASAAGTLHTSAGDFARYLAALNANPGLLAQLLAEPLTADAAIGLRWTLGWGLFQPAGATPDDRALWQWGHNPGYRAFAMAWPARGDAFVLLSSGEGGLRLAEALLRQSWPASQALFSFRMLR